MKEKGKRISVTVYIYQITNGYLVETNPYTNPDRSTYCETLEDAVKLGKKYLSTSLLKRGRS
jgi:hypothetical protein